MADFEKKYSLKKVKQPTDEYIKNVKQVLVNKGIVNENTPYSDLDDVTEENLVNLKPENIKAGIQIGNVEGQIGVSIEDINTNDYASLPLFYAYYIASNNTDCYAIYSNNRNILYYYNLETKESTKLYTGLSNRIFSKFFEDSKGNVYVADSSTYLIGASLYVNKTYCKKLNEYSFTFFEDSKGNVYGGTNEDSSGIFLIDGEHSNKIEGTTGCGWKNFFEDSKGNVYVGSNSSNKADDYGIYLLNRDGTQEKVYTTGYNWRYFFEDSKGNVYASASTNDFGILRINNNRSEKVYDLGNSWRHFFEDSKGNLFASSTSISSIGIIKLNEESENKQKYSLGYNWSYFFEDSKGNVYVSSSSSDSKCKGVICISEETTKQIYNDWHSWRYFFEDSKGNVYVSSSNSNGIVLINDSASSVIYSSDTNWQYFSEKNDIGVLVTKDKEITSDSIILVLIDNQVNFFVKKG
jgi:hypothetical protein